MDILFVAGFAPITTDPSSSASLYRDQLGLPLQAISEGYVAMEGFDGVKHFGVWPLTMAAQSCFGSDTWPDDVPVPQASIEFEVADVAEAARELLGNGMDLVHETRTEPWGQTIARFLSPEGLLIGICSTPGLTPDER